MAIHRNNSQEIKTQVVTLSSGHKVTLRWTDEGLRKFFERKPSRQINDTTTKVLQRS